jgi:hypothetical protein
VGITPGLALQLFALLGCRRLSTCTRCGRALR